jgi:hypothetical protein
MERLRFSFCVLVLMGCSTTPGNADIGEQVEVVSQRDNATTDSVGENGDAGSGGDVHVREGDALDDGLCLHVDCKAIVFACINGCSTKTVLLDNYCTDTLTIELLQFAQASSDIDLVNPPPLPIDIPEAGHPSYSPVSFGIRYCPSDQNYDDSNTLLIKTNDLSLKGGTLEIPVEVKPTPGILEFAHDEDLLYLDFTKKATHWVSMHNKPAFEYTDLCADADVCCGCPISVKDVVLDPPDAGAWYTVIPTDPVTEESLSLPHALNCGDTIRFDVSYQIPAGQSGDRNATMCIQYVAPFVGPQNYCVGLHAADVCEFSLAPVHQILDFNSPSAAEVKEKPVVLINNGTVPCTVSKLSVTDKWGRATADFELKDGPIGEIAVPPFGLLPIWVQFSPHEELSGQLNIEYVDYLAGTVGANVTLVGHKGDNCALPVADPGDGYDNAVAGDWLTLDGCGSSGGECGSPIYEHGYLWYLLSKPEGSTAQLNTEGTCMTSFVPDVAGQYVVALMVYDGTDFFQSELATTVVTVVPVD